MRADVEGAVAELLGERWEERKLGEREE